jgi:hypothetical protein
MIGLFGLLLASGALLVANAQFEPVPLKESQRAAINNIYNALRVLL